MLYKVYIVQNCPLKREERINLRGSVQNFISKPFETTPKVCKNAL